MKKIVFLLASAFDPHYLKKVDAFKEHGYDVDVYGFRRNVNLSGQYDDVVLLDFVKNKNYIRRLNTVYRCINNIINYYDHTDVVFYATTFDIALVCLRRRVKYIYGISDIVHSAFPCYLRSLFRYIDRKIVRNSCVTVLTSPAFIDYLQLNLVEQGKCIYLLNKLNKIYWNKKRPEVIKPSIPITIGFVGNIRYPASILRLAEVVGQKFPNFKFIYFGKGEEKVMNIVQRQCCYFENVVYAGPFNNKKDLDSIYAQLDIIACNYDIRTINERLLEPNKFYESIFYNKPIIVTEGTYLADRVKTIGCGILTDNSIHNITSLLSDLTIDEIYKKSEAANKIEMSELIEDYTHLFDVINTI